MELASFALSLDWFDSCSDAELLCSTLRWCDTNQGRYFREGCVGTDPHIAHELAELWVRARTPGSPQHNAHRFPGRPSVRDCCVWVQAGEIVMVNNTVELLLPTPSAVRFDRFPTDFRLIFD